MGFYFGMLRVHNHTATPGDGGALSNVTIGGTLQSDSLTVIGLTQTATFQASGQASAAAATAPANIPTYEQALALGLL